MAKHQNAWTPDTLDGVTFLYEWDDELPEDGREHTCVGVGSHVVKSRAVPVGELDNPKVGDHIKAVIREAIVQEMVRGRPAPKSVTIEETVFDPHISSDPAECAALWDHHTANNQYKNVVLVPALLESLPPEEKMPQRNALGNIVGETFISHPEFHTDEHGEVAIKRWRTVRPETLEAGHQIVANMKKARKGSVREHVNKVMSAKLEAQAKGG